MVDARKLTATADLNAPPTPSMARWALRSSIHEKCHGRQRSNRVAQLEKEGTEIKWRQARWSLLGRRPQRTGMWRERCCTPLRCWRQMRLGGKRSEAHAPQAVATILDPLTAALAAWWAAIDADASPPAWRGIRADAFASFSRLPAARSWRVAPERSRSMRLSQSISAVAATMEVELAPLPLPHAGATRGTPRRAASARARCAIRSATVGTRRSR
jgi:hypothetical protein